MATRWHPFRERYGLSSGLYAQGGVGFAAFTLPSDEVVDGIAASAAIGWISGKLDDDWASGFELRDEVAWFADGRGLSNSISVTLFLQLRVPLP